MNMMMFQNFQVTSDNIQVVIIYTSGNCEQK